MVFLSERIRVKLWRKYATIFIHFACIFNAASSSWLWCDVVFRFASVFVCARLFENSHFISFYVLNSNVRVSSFINSHLTVCKMLLLLSLPMSSLTKSSHFIDTHANQSLDVKACSLVYCLNIGKRDARICFPCKFISLLRYICVLCTYL